MRLTEQEQSILQIILWNHLKVYAAKSDKEYNQEIMCILSDVQGGNLKVFSNCIILNIACQILNLLKTRNCFANEPLLLGLNDFTIEDIKELMEKIKNECRITENIF